MDHIRDSTRDGARLPHAGSGVAAALGILEALARAEQPLTLGELARRLGISRATVARVLPVLVAAGYVARLPSRRRYSLDYGVLTLAGDLLQGLVLRQRAAPHLHRLALRTQLVAYLGVLWRGQTVVLDRVSPCLVPAQAPDIGRHVPMHGSSMGKAILAFLPEEVRLAFLAGYTLFALTPRTITDPAAFDAELALTRARGYATSDEELAPNARSIAAPIFDARGLPVGALAAADWDPAQMPPERLTAVIEATREAALAVSHTLGYAGRGAHEGLARSAARHVALLSSTCQAPG